MNQTFSKSNANIAAINKEIEFQEKIIEFLQTHDDSIDLPKRVKDAYDKYDFCDNLLRANLTNKRIVNTLRYKFKISRSQAYRIIQKTKIVFANFNPESKNYYKSFLLDSIIDTIRVSKAAGVDGLPEKIRAEANLIKLLGFDKSEPYIDPSLKYQKTIVISTDPSVIGLPKIENVEELKKSYYEDI